MPQIGKPEFMSTSAPETPASPTLGERLEFALGFLRRRYLVVSIPLLLSLALGGLYLFTAPPIFTASATMMIETRKGVLQDYLVNTPPDPAWVESQIGVLKSVNVAAYVVKQLRLAEDHQLIHPT